LRNLRVLDLEGNKLEYLATEISALHCVTLLCTLSLFSCNYTCTCIDHTDTVYESFSSG